LSAVPFASLATSSARPAKPLARVGTPRLSVVVVNYRQWDETEELVRQLQASASVKHGDAEIVIVDNHSPHHPLMKRLRRQPNVSLRRWRQNRGFARAVNEGCRLSRGDWFLLLNPDTTPSEGFLDSVLAMLDRLEPNAGIVGFHLRNGDGSRQLSAGPFPTLVSTIARLALPRSRRKYHTLRTPNRCRVDWVTGCCLLVRRDCLNELGGLDESFFLYYEDVDLCRRARERGWSVWYEPNLAVVHHHPLHQRSVPAVLRLVTRHSLMMYAANHWPAWQFKLLARIVQSESWLRRIEAWWSGDTHQAAVFTTLAVVCRDLRRGEIVLARERIEKAVRRVDVRVGV
jgi:N-acetylglucosaminyl-diphospho-decaprenol L-rhamnosyltransferase